MERSKVKCMIIMPVYYVLTTLALIANAAFTYTYSSYLTRTALIVDIVVIAIIVVYALIRFNSRKVHVSELH